MPSEMISPAQDRASGCARIVEIAMDSSGIRNDDVAERNACPTIGLVMTGFHLTFAAADDRASDCVGYAEGFSLNALAAELGR